MKIGLFDSGIGGFSLLSELDRSMQGVTFYYIADHQFSPYGNKTSQEIMDRSRLLTRQLLDEGVDLVVVACNTATAMAINFLRQEFPKTQFVGIEPYLNVINRHPELVDSYKGVVLSTVGTNSSERFLALRRRLDPNNHLNYIGLPNLATIIEQFYIDKDSTRLHQQVRTHLDEHVEHKYDFAVLGCTHYPLIKNLIEQALDVRCYSPAKFVAKRVMSLLDYSDHNEEEDVKVASDTYYYSTAAHDEWQLLKTQQLLDLFHSEEDRSL